MPYPIKSRGLGNEKALAATPANERLGGELFENGAVETLESGENRVLARIGGSEAGGRRTVEFALMEGDFSWSCTCKKSQERFCKHAAALAIALRGESR